VDKLEYFNQVGRHVVRYGRWKCIWYLMRLKLQKSTDSGQVSALSLRLPTQLSSCKTSALHRSASTFSSTPTSAASVISSRGTLSSTGGAVARVTVGTVSSSTSTGVSLPVCMLDEFDRPRVKAVMAHDNNQFSEEGNDWTSGPAVSAWLALSCYARNRPGRRFQAT
jgi:hypothetical protein